MSAGPYYLMLMRHPGLRPTYKTTEITTEQLIGAVSALKLQYSTHKNIPSNPVRYYRPM